ncbi:hypothetical protein Glove_87g238 [Diversispora epigaea]|uniref:Uncharacterized protein n=1 Tax=Diversispora epigaea TaxID=1348612 RepID=A0A397JAH5_9GLOM|nr:hypothetical protein Glove_87g238 [Diversispora epigaea]
MNQEFQYYQMDLSAGLRLSFDQLEILRGKCLEKLNLEFEHLGEITRAIIHKALKRKIFDTWQQAFDIIKGWAKYKGFKVKYDRVERNPMELFANVLVL